MREYLTCFRNVTRYYYNFCQKMEFRELFVLLKISNLQKCIKNENLNKFSCRYIYILYHIFAHFT